jgi:fermentation-respiration switch protein FrsA (DUF1100 family)
VKSLILISVFCYCLLLLAMYFFQRSMMYFPDTEKPTVFDGVEEVSVTTSDGLHISAWFVAGNAPADRVIAFFHGNGGKAAHRIYKAALYAQQGYSVMLAEYRGYGGNAGRPSEEGLYRDARAQIDYLINVRSYGEDQIILYGESIGSGVAVQMATEYPDAHALILETPFSSMVDLAAPRYFYIPVRLLLLDRYMNADKISSVHMPVFIGHGKNDETVPYSSARALFDNIEAAKKFVDYEQGNHNNLYQFGFADDALLFLSGIDQNNEDNNSIEILTEE